MQPRFGSLGRRTLPPGRGASCDVRAQLSPDSTSIREALGRALFHTQHYSEAAEEFQAVVDHAPTNDYALFF